MYLEKIFVGEERRTRFIEVFPRRVSLPTLITPTPTTPHHKRWRQRQLHLLLIPFLSDRNAWCPPQFAPPAWLSGRHRACLPGNRVAVARASPPRAPVAVASPWPPRPACGPRCPVRHGPGVG